MYTGRSTRYLYALKNWKLNGLCTIEKDDTLDARCHMLAMITHLKATTMSLTHSTVTEEATSLFDRRMALIIPILPAVTIKAM